MFVTNYVAIMSLNVCFFIFTNQVCNTQIVNYSKEYKMEQLINLSKVTWITGNCTRTPTTYFRSLLPFAWHKPHSGIGRLYQRFNQNPSTCSSRANQRKLDNKSFRARLQCGTIFASCLISGTWGPFSSRFIKRAFCNQILVRFVQFLIVSWWWLWPLLTVCIDRSYMFG